MDFIDFFAGIGGFRRGMEMAGHKCIGFCEFDKFAAASYISMHLITEEQRAHLATLDLKKRQKEILKDEYLNGEWYSNDIRNVDARSLPKADCWCFGAPCQDFSVAGKRAGLDGDRSSLIKEIFRILREIIQEGGKINPNGLSMKTLRECYRATPDEIILRYSWKWTNWGTIQNGSFLTANITEYPRTGNECILSDILEPAVPQKYFLSKEQTEKIVFQSN